MKKFYTISISIIFLLFLSSNLFSQTPNWRIVDSLFLFNGKPIALTYADIRCVDSNNCTAVFNLNGAWPYSRTTTDGGKTWFTTLYDSSSFYNDAVSVQYPSLDLCLVFCRNGYYWRSTDTCKTWERSRITDKPNGWPGATVMLNPKFGIVYVHEDTTFISETNKSLFRTRDSAKTWERINIKVDNINYSINGAISIAIIDTSTYLVLITEPMQDDFTFPRHLIGTEDGGKTWKEYPYPTQDRKIDLRKLENFGLTGWAIGDKDMGNGYNNAFIYKTYDGGKSWEKCFERDSFGVLQMSFYDTLNGMVLGHRSLIYYTSDGGSTWSVEDNFNDSYYSKPIDNIFRIEMAAPNVAYGTYGWLARIYRRYWYTTDVKEEKNNISNYHVFPNPCPSGSELNLRFNVENFSNLNFSLYNYVGEKIGSSFSNYFAPGEHTIQYIPDNPLSTGAYFIKIDDGEKEVISIPVVIEN